MSDDAKWTLLIGMFLVWGLVVWNAMEHHRYLVAVKLRNGPIAFVLTVVVYSLLFVLTFRKFIA